MAIWKVLTLPYYTETNRQVEQAHQMLMCMIGKLSKDWKVDLPEHLPELVHAYNSYEIGYHWIQPILLDVWVLTMLTC